MIRQLAWVAVLALVTAGCASSDADHGSSSGGAGPRMNNLHNFAFEGEWQVHVTPDTQAAQAGATGFDDTLSFKDGVFTSRACARDGLNSANYSVMSLESTPQFSAIMTRDDRQTASWSGHIIAGKIHGVVVWDKHWSQNNSYHFEGSR